MKSYIENDDDFLFISSYLIRKINKIYPFALYNQSIFYIRLGYHNSVRKYIKNIMNEFL